MSIFNKAFGILFVFHSLYCVHSINREYDTDAIPKSIRRRQNAIPKLFVKGTHYEVGFMIGETFGQLINEFVANYDPLVEYLDYYANSTEAQQIYTESLDAVNLYFPQYLIELKGISDGSKVEFHVLFLIHLDDILTYNLGNKAKKDYGGTGCSSIMVNNPFDGNMFLGHNEDALNATINHFYVVSAHIEPGPNEFGGLFNARQERWESMTYAASLSGYASGFNEAGIVFSINTIFNKHLIRGKIPRTFLTRALLASRADISEVESILMNVNVGTADGFHVNLIIQNHTAWFSSRFYSIEVTPSETEYLSQVDIEEIPVGTTTFHTNILHRLTYEEIRESGWYSSVARESRFGNMTAVHPVENAMDILVVLGDTEDPQWEIYRDRVDDPVNTINTGLFDVMRKSWTLWTNNPKYNYPAKTFPLRFTTYMDSIADVSQA